MHTKNPVFLVHGFWDRCTIFKKMALNIEKQGIQVHDRLNLIPNNGKYGIASLASQLKDYIENSVDLNCQIDIVAFSMGGLVSRYYIQNLCTSNKVNKLITIATPHHGTHMAKIFNYQACIEMRPNSKFIVDLNSEINKLSSIEITSIWAKYDTTIVPNNSSRLPFGNEIILPFGIHPLLPQNSQVIDYVIEILKRH